MARFSAREAKRKFEERLSSLESDTRRCFHPIDGIPPAPFPATMYVLATIDYFSSYWAGWNDIRVLREKTQRGLLDDTRSQTQRMVEFLAEYLRYREDDSRTALHWKLSRLEDLPPGQTSNLFTLDLLTLLRDLRIGIFGERGYYDRLLQSADLTRRYQEFDAEAYPANPER